MIDEFDKNYKTIHFVHMCYRPYSKIELERKIRYDFDLQLNS